MLNAKCIISMSRVAEIWSRDAADLDISAAQAVTAQETLACDKPDSQLTAYTICMPDVGFRDWVCSTQYPLLDTADPRSFRKLMLQCCACIVQYCCLNMSHLNSRTSKLQ